MHAVKWAAAARVPAKRGRTLCRAVAGVLLLGCMAAGMHASRPPAPAGLERRGLRSTEPGPLENVWPHGSDVVLASANATEAAAACGSWLQAKYSCSEEACADQVQGFINYLYLRECIMPDDGALFWAGLIAWLVALLYLLGDTADEYFTAVLQTFVTVLQISPNVAGVTLLSFGNGAPDVFASLAAFLSDAGSVGLAAILGAGVFVTTVVVGAVALVSEARVQKSLFLRDVAFSILAVLYLMGTFIDNKITAAESLGLVAVYVAFVLVVLFGRRAWAWWTGQAVVASVADSVPGLLTAASVQDASRHTLLREDMLPKLAMPTCAAAAASVNAKPSETSPRSRGYSAEWHRAITQREATGLLHAEGRSLDESALAAPSPACSARHTSHRHSTQSQLSCYAVAHAGQVHTLARATPGALLSTGGAAIFRAQRHYAERVLRALDAAKAAGKVGVAPDGAYHSMAGALDTPAEPLPPCAARRPAAHKPAGSTPDIQPARNGAHSSCLARAGAIAGRAWELLLWPSDMLRKLTVPLLPGDADEAGAAGGLPATYDWRATAATPVLGCPFLLFTAYGTLGSGWQALAPVSAGTPWLPRWALALMVGCCVAVALFVHLGKRHRVIPPEGRTRLGLTVFAFFTSVSWIIVLANEIVTALQAAGELLHIPSAALGLTVLAWGNSLGDYICDVAVARHGTPEMGLAAAYAGTMFNLLIGLGLSLTVGTLRHGGLSLQEDPANTRIVWVCFAAWLASLLSALIVVPMTGFVILRPHALGLLCLYAAFLALSLYVGLGM